MHRIRDWLLPIPDQLLAATDRVKQFTRDALPDIPAIGFFSRWIGGIGLHFCQVRFPDRLHILGEYPPVRQEARAEIVVKDNKPQARGRFHCVGNLLRAVCGGKRQAQRRELACGDGLARIGAPERLQSATADRGIRLESLNQRTAEFGECRIPVVFEFAEPLLGIVCLRIGGR